MITTRWRVLLHSMTFKRDFGPVYILSKLLEKLGCECVVANNRNLLTKRLRLWNPHAVIFLTLSRMRDIKKVFPKAKLFYYSGEAGDNSVLSPEYLIIKDPFLYNSISKTYLWGNTLAKALLADFKKFKHLPSNKDFESKFFLAGNPSIDIAKYGLKCSTNDRKIKIGLIGSFSLINNPNASLIYSLYETNSNTHYAVYNIVFEEARFQVNLLETYKTIIEKLDPNKYEVSFRPYPLESMDNYKEVTFFTRHNVTIDDSISFFTWLSNQDVILGGSSTTIIQLMITNRPYINLDLLHNRTTVPDDLKRLECIKSKHCPKTMDELFYMIER
ncbi:MAG: hypothetical protein HQK51_14915, partial [Oligoflexia bacterium]|nr:hypothetical protein [Oligoflexia bacterium]